MFVVLWEFDVKSECIDRFTTAYAANGDWARLFAEDAKFCETRLLQNISEPLRFVTMDIWESRDDYERFLSEKAAAYGDLDAECADWTTSERHLCWFDADAAELDVKRATISLKSRI
jgi:heme-degrading monooxygenase HmoA